MSTTYYAIVLLGTGIGALTVLATLFYSLKPWARLVFVLQFWHYEKYMGAHAKRMRFILFFVFLSIGIAIAAPVWFILLANGTSGFSAYITFISSSVLATSLLISVGFTFYLFNLNTSVDGYADGIVESNPSSTPGQNKRYLRRTMLLNGIMCLLSTALSFVCLVYYEVISQATLNGEDSAQDNPVYLSLQDVDFFLAAVASALPSVFVFLFDGIERLTGESSHRRPIATTSRANRLSFVGSRSGILTKVSRNEILIHP